MIFRLVLAIYYLKVYTVTYRVGAHVWFILCAGRTGSCRPDESFTLQQARRIPLSYVSGISPPAFDKFWDQLARRCFYLKNKTLMSINLVAILAAMSIVFGKLIAFDFGAFRISFENLPIMLASFILGPLYGGACGLVADLVGTSVKFGVNNINPIITVAMVLMGIIPGLLTRYLFKNYKTNYVIISGFISHVVCSMTIKTIALHVWPGQPYYTMPYTVLLSQRIPTYFIIGLLESYICSILINRKVFKKEITRM